MFRPIVLLHDAYAGWISVAQKVNWSFLCENFQRQSCGRTIPLSNGVYMFTVNVTLEPNI